MTDEIAGGPAEQIFDTLCEAIAWVFRYEQIPMLSLDRIMVCLQQQHLYLKKKDHTVSCSTVIRRRISSTLSSSELFVRAGPVRACLWALRPNNPHFLSNGAIFSSVQQMLTNNGPLTIEQMVVQTQLHGADIGLFERFMSGHEFEFVQLDDGTVWFAKEPLPVARNFTSICDALQFAFLAFPEGASVEALTRYLSLVTVGGMKTITRRSVSRELSRYGSVFHHQSRARYVMVEAAVPPPHVHRLPPVVIPMLTPRLTPVTTNRDDDIFDAANFFDVTVGPFTDPGRRDRDDDEFPLRMFSMFD